MQKIRVFIVTLVVAILLSALVLGIVAPTSVHVLTDPIHLLVDEDPGGGQGGGG